MRYELKYQITPFLQHTLLKRFENIMAYDRFSGKDGYIVSSLYFDDIRCSAYHQKIDGVSDRVKYRARVYNHSDKSIKLEKKKRISGFIEKQTRSLQRCEYERMCNGDFSFLLESDAPYSRQFYTAFSLSRLKPATVVEYHRIAFADAAGTRVTFDDNLKASVLHHDLFSNDAVYLNAGERENVILEVKFTNVLPEAVRMALNQSNVQLRSISKYAMCMEKRFEVTQR